MQSPHHFSLNSWRHGLPITEERTEELLTLQTRSLPMPDGTWKPFTHFKMTWEAMDFLMICGKGMYSRAMLVDLALKESLRSGREFMACFVDACSFHEKALTEKIRTDGLHYWPPRS